MALSITNISLSRHCSLYTKYDFESEALCNVATSLHLYDTPRPHSHTHTHTHTHTLTHTLTHPHTLTAKEHSKVVRSHNYINVQRTPPTQTPRRLVITDSTHSTNHDATENNQKNEALTRTTPPQMTTPPQRPRSSYVNVVLAGQLPPEPKTPLSPFPMDTSFSLTQSDEVISPLSPTPLLDEGISPLSPAPSLPPRHYSDSEFSQRSDRSNSNPEDCTSPEPLRAPVQHMCTTQGHEYAVIHRGVKGDDEDTPIHRIISPPPPVPLKPRQRLAQDAHKAGYTEIAEKSLQNRVYAELEIPSSHSDHSSQNSNSPVAYAVVDLGRETAPSAPSIERRRQMTTRRELVPLKPRPYETPTLSTENLADPGYSTVRDKPSGGESHWVQYG